MSATLKTGILYGGCMIIGAVIGVSIGSTVYRRTCNKQHSQTLSSPLPLLPQHPPPPPSTPQPVSREEFGPETEGAVERCMTNEDACARYDEAYEIWMGTRKVRFGMTQEQLRRYLKEVFEDGVDRNYAQCYANYGDFLFSSMYLNGCRGDRAYNRAVDEAMSIYRMGEYHGCGRCAARLEDYSGDQTAFDNSWALKSHLLHEDTLKQLPEELIDIIVGYGTICSIGEAKRCFSEAFSSCIAPMVSLRLQKRAAELGHRDAQMNLSVALYNYKDYKGAMLWAKIAIGQRSNEPMRASFLQPIYALFGDLYRMGQAVERNLDKAIEYYQRMDDGGARCVLLGSLYRDHLNDPVMALEYFSEGARHPYNDEECINQLHDLCARHPKLISPFIVNRTDDDDDDDN